MKFLYLYLTIGAIVSLIYTMYYMSEKKQQLKNLNATSKQIQSACMITFFITFLIYPFVLGELIVNGIKKIGGNKKND
jgi:hypothetical protein